MKREVVIINYGMGNLWSVKSALDFIDVETVISSDPKKITTANILVLPGVGAFRRAMNSLNKAGISEAIVEAVSRKKSKILGICLGMQLLGQSSTEDGFTEGLSLIKSKSEKFNNDHNPEVKIPHVGFNSVLFPENSILFKQLEQESDFYFTHSYKMTLSNLGGLVSKTHYAGDFLAAYEQENIFATQFHPEKSQTNGLKLLHNFIVS
jgi:glutamine amidotransferase